jgi:hypothetical protein
MVTHHHYAQMKEFHNGRWLFVLPSHFGPSLVKQNKAILQANQKWLFFMLIIHVYTHSTHTSLRPQLMKISEANQKK